jgi:hypothetical protein
MIHLDEFGIVRCILAEAELKITGSAASHARRSYG